VLFYQHISFFLYVHGLCNDAR